MRRGEGRARLNPRVTLDRRAFVGAAAMTLGSPSPGHALPPRAPGGALGPLRRVFAGDLEVAYAELGPARGQVVLLLHGWPYDIHTYAEAGEQLAATGYRVIIPHLRGFGATRFRDAAAMRNGQQAIFALDALRLLDALGVAQAIVGGCDWGSRTANILAALWPERVHALVSVSGYLIGSQAAGARPLAPAAEQSWWYQFYFATDRGRDGYAADPRGFAELIWRNASPQWAFDSATFARSAASLDNPDHVSIVIHNYRWRLGTVPGDPALDSLERRLASFPPIVVPTVTLEGDANGAPHPDPASYAAKFKGPYAHRSLTGGVGHNLPQEAPRPFAQAVLDADRMASARG